MPQNEFQKRTPLILGITLVLGWTNGMATPQSSAGNGTVTDAVKNAAKNRGSYTSDPAMVPRFTNPAAGYRDR